MKRLLILACLAMLLAGCGDTETDKQVQRLDKPYSDKIKAVEQKQLQQADDQLKAIDEQTSGKQKRDDQQGGG